MVESKGNPNTEIRSWRFLKLFFVCTKNVYYIKNTQKASFFCQEFRVISFSRTIGEMFHRFQIFAALIIFVSRFCSTLFLEKNGRRHASKYLIDPRPICAAIHRIEGGNLAQPDFFLLFCRYPSERQMREIGGQLRILTQPSHVSPTEKWKKKKEKNAFSDVTRFEVYSGHKVCMGCQSE